MVDDSETSVPTVGKRLLSRSRRQMLLQIVAATIILACGLVIGSGAALLHFKDDIVPSRLPMPGEMAQEVRNRYGLTDEQTEKAEAVLGASRDRMYTLFVGTKEKMEAEFQELSAAMKTILTPEQFERWEYDSKNRRRRGPGRFGGGPGPGGRPGSGRPGPGDRPGGFGGGPGGGRSGRGRSGPDGRSGQGRPEYREFGSRSRRPAEPNSPETRSPAEPNSQVE